MVFPPMNNRNLLALIGARPTIIMHGMQEAPPIRPSSGSYPVPGVDCFIQQETRRRGFRA